MSITGSKNLKAENLQFVSHSVQTIFMRLHKIRRDGQYLGPTGQVWVWCKTLKIQTELIILQFSHQDIVIKILHQHVQKNSMLKNKFKIQIKSLKEDVLKTLK